MKKIISFLIINLIFVPFKSIHAGPYIGANAGANFLNISKKVSYAQTTTKLSDNYSGFRGQFLIGYNFPMLEEPDLNQLISIAIEADGNYNSGNASSKINPWFLNTSASVIEQLKYGYDIFVLSKLRLASQISFFAGPGLSQGKFNVSTPTQTAGNLGITGNATTWLTGWAVKAGVEIPMSNFINFDVTYQYSCFDSIAWTRVEPLTGENVTARYKPAVNSLTLGFNWSC